MTVFDLATPARGGHHVIGRVGPTLQTLWRSCAARARAHELDELIADEDRPAASELRAARGRQLVTVRQRAALAAQIEECVAAAVSDIRGQQRRTSVWLVDVRDTEVRAAAAELLDLAYALRASGRVEPRGVAMATRLVRDGESPLYVAHGPDDVAKAASAARAALSARSLD
jgi:hypothetical protein